MCGPDASAWPHSPPSRGRISIDLTPHERSSGAQPGSVLSYSAGYNIELSHF